MLISLVNKHVADYFFVAFDCGKSAFRSAIFPDYKANRECPPDELKEQFPLFREACVALGFPIVEKVGFEADDLIATYAEKLSSCGFKVKIVSVDKDLVQLVNDNITVFDPAKSLAITRDEVVKKYGVSPAQMVFFQALVGDVADNVPGVSAIGPVTAAKLLNKYHTLDGIYANIEKIEPPRIREKLKCHRDDAELSLKLVTLDRNVPIGNRLDDCNIGGARNGYACAYNYEKAADFLGSLGFHSLIKRLQKAA
jgi:DNA polymerase-1